MSTVNTTPVNSESTNLPQGPEHRARYIGRPDDQVASFQDLYQAGQQTYLKGRRGFLGPFIIHQVLGNGSYRLKNEQGQILPDTYVEDDLNQNPFAGSATGV